MHERRMRAGPPGKPPGGASAAVADRRAAERIQALYNANIIGAVVVDSTGVLLESNDYFLDLVGRTRAELERGEIDVTAMTPPEWQPSTDHALTEARTRGSAAPYEKAYLRPDGTRVPVLVADIGLPGPGRLVAAFVLDNTERHRAEEALRAAHDRERRLLDARLIGTLIVRDSGEILEANDYFLDLVGHSRYELERGELDWRALTPPEWMPVSDRMVGNARADGSVAPYEKEYWRADGTRVPALVVAMSLPGPDNLIAAFVLDLTEHKRASRERDRLAAAVEQSPNGVVIMDADLRIAYANPVYAASVGLAAAELVGRSAADVMSIGVGEATVADAASTVAAGQPWSREVDHRNPDGTVSRSEVNITPLRGADGEISGWLAVMRDVTEREQDRAALAASEARLRTALDTMLDAVVVASAVRDETGRIVDFRVEYANPAIGPISGVGATDQIGHTLLGQFPAHGANGLFDAYVAVVETGVPCRIYDFHYVDPEAAGGPLDQYVDQYAAKLGDGYVLSVRDVTERHRTEAERARLAAAIEESEDRILIANADTRITYANAAFAADLGQEPSDLVGRNAFEVISVAVDATTMARLAEIVGSAKPWLGEIDSRRVDGSDRRLQVRLTPRGEAGGLIANIRDVTDLRRAEAELARHGRDLELATWHAALAERHRLSREMHDGLAQDLWLAKLKASRLEALSRRRPEAALLVRQLTDALDAALADARAAVTTLPSTQGAPPPSLSELMEDEIKDLSDRFGLPIEFASGPGLPALPPLDQAQILRIVREALTNARRHANATLVKVSLEALDGSVSVTVSDDGRGFDPAGVPPASPGLAGMRERATLIGGSLTIDSRPSAGTTVALRVPVGPPGGTGLEARL